MQITEGSHHQVLQIIYQIVKEDPYPLKYRIYPRELILRSMQDWSSIQLALTALEKEGAITIQQSDKLQISLTVKGLEICQAAETK